MPEFGQIAAYAQDLGYGQQVQDLRYREQMLRQQDELNKAKVKLFSDSLEFQQGGNAFDAPLVKAESEKIVQQLGEYMADNPDWESNIKKSSYINSLKRSLKDNPT